MAEQGATGRAYKAWLIVGLLLLFSFLAFEYYLLSVDREKYAFYAILIERQILTFVITGGALFASCWSLSVQRGRNAALAGVISSLALAVISVHFQLWEVYVGGSAAWAETLLTFDVTTLLILIVVPLMIAIFAILFETFQDSFADNHTDQREHGFLKTIALWLVWLVLLMVLFLYDSALFSYYDSLYVAEARSRQDEIDFGILSTISNVMRNWKEFGGYFLESLKRPINYVTPFYTLSVTGAAQYIATREIEARRGRYSGHG